MLLVNLYYEEARGFFFVGATFNCGNVSVRRYTCLRSCYFNVLFLYSVCMQSVNVFTNASCLIILILDHKWSFILNYNIKFIFKLH